MQHWPPAQVAAQGVMGKFAHPCEGARWGVGDHKVLGIEEHFSARSSLYRTITGERFLGGNLDPAADSAAHIC